MLYLVSLREQRAVFLSLSCTEVVPKNKIIGLLETSSRISRCEQDACVELQHRDEISDLVLEGLGLELVGKARPIGTRSGGLALSCTAQVRYHSTTAAPSYLSHK